MLSKKPPPARSTAAKAKGQPPSRKTTLPVAPNPRPLPDKHWQRSKRYGWDSR